MSTKLNTLGTIYTDILGQVYLQQANKQQFIVGTLDWMFASLLILFIKCPLHAVNNP